jgi:hypothetical protein
MTFLTSVPPVKASPGHIPLIYLHCNLRLFIYTYALRLGVVMKTLDALILGTNVLNLSPYRLDALLNRADKSRVISCHSRDIGVACLHFCNHYKDDG